MAGPSAAEPSSGGTLALSAILAIVRATRECLASEEQSDSAPSEKLSVPPGEEAAAARESILAGQQPILAGKGPDVLRVALGAEKADQASTSLPGGQGQLHAEGLGLGDGRKVRLELVGLLASFPNNASPLGAPELEQVLDFLLRSICGAEAPPDRPSTDEQEDAAADDGSSAAAADALAAMAGQGHDKLLAQLVLPQLLQAATSCSSSDSGEQGQRWRGRGALAALSRIAVASGDLHREIRSALVDALADSLAQPEGLF